MAEGGAAAPGRPRLRRTPGGTHSPSHGSSGRCSASGSAIGSSRVSHAPALDDKLDRIDSDGIKDFAIIRDVTNDDIALLAGRRRAKKAAARQGGDDVLRRRSAARRG